MQCGNVVFALEFAPWLDYPSQEHARHGLRGKLRGNLALDGAWFEIYEATEWQSFHDKWRIWETLGVWRNSSRFLVNIAGCAEVLRGIWPPTWGEPRMFENSS